MIRPAPCLLLVTALALAGCVASDASPTNVALASTEDDDDDDDDDDDERQAPQLAARDATQTELERGWAVIHYDALVRRANAALDMPDGGVPRTFVEWGIGRGDAIELYFLAVRGIAPPSRVAEDELLVVIEGRGVLEVNGRAREVMPGALCALPAGARGNLEAAARNAPLYALLVRTRAPLPADAPRRREPWFGDIADVPVAPPARAAGPRMSTVRAFAGRLGLHALAMAPGTSWGAEWAQSGHDLVLFVLRGDCNLGVGNAGGRAAQGSVALVPAGVSWYVMTSSDESLSALVFATPEVPDLAPDR